MATGNGPRLRQRKGEPRRGITRLGSPQGERRGYSGEGKALALKRRSGP
jgi:hypothetical protein